MPPTITRAQADDDPGAAASSQPTICSVSGLTVGYRTRDNDILRACREVGFRIEAGRTLAVIGETGSGKTSVASAVTRLLPGSGTVVAGDVVVAGTDILGLSEKEMREVRGRVIGYVPQQPMSAFNPTMVMGRQVAEPLVLHSGMSYREALPLVAETLAEVGLHDPERVIRSYPHELSGGMLQRAMLATAVICGPSLLVADEPTSALDVTIQRQILDLLRRLQRQRNLAVFIISHDLGIVSRIADYVLVMYGGRAVEFGPRSVILDDPRHPYTIALMESMIGSTTGHKARLRTAPGYPPSLRQVHEELGCPFRARCSNAVPACVERFPAADGAGPDHLWACHNPRHVE
jgi:oligopeptide/dipeptide ABC transporter ATP-binding protein